MATQDESALYSTTSFAKSVSASAVRAMISLCIPALIASMDRMGLAELVDEHFDQTRVQLGAASNQRAVARGFRVMFA